MLDRVFGLIKRAASRVDEPSVFQVGLETVREHLEANRLEDAVAVLNRIVGAEAPFPAPQSSFELTCVGTAHMKLYQLYHDYFQHGHQLRERCGVHAARAEEAFRSARDAPRFAEAIGCQVLLYAEAGRPDEVAHALRKLQGLSPDLATWLASYADGVLLLSADPARAAGPFQQCLDTLHLVGASAEAWRIQCEQKLAALGQGTPPVPDASHSLPQRIRTVVTAFSMLEGDPTATLAYAREHVGPVLHDVEEMRLRITSEAKQREISAATHLLYLAASKIAEVETRFDDAVDRLESNTSRSLLSKRAMQWLWSRAPQQTFRELAESKLRIRDLVSQEGFDQGQPRLTLSLERHREVMHGIEERLQAMVPGPHDGFSPVASSALRAALAPDDAVLMFTQLGTVYVLESSGVQAVGSVDPELNGLCDAWHRLARDARSDRGDMSRLEDRIARQCLAPAIGRLAGKRRLFVVPSNSVWSVPLSAIGAQPLADALDVAYVPSLSALSALLTRARTPSTPPFMLAVGDPAKNLPSARAEAAAAARHFPNSTLLLGDDSDGSLLSALQRADYVHLACHGGFFSEFPELSALEVVGQGSVEPMLHVEDLVRLPMQAQLVVLAACHAGNNTELPGGEYAGFPSAFLSAGAATVLAPLWAVDDGATAALMDQFYRELGSHSPARALHLARSRVRQMAGYEHPYYWAAFQLFGDPSSGGTRAAFATDGHAVAGPPESTPAPGAGGTRPIGSLKDIRAHAVSRPPPAPLVAGVLLEELYCAFIEQRPLRGAWAPRADDDSRHRTQATIRNKLLSVGVASDMVERLEQIIEELVRLSERNPENLGQLMAAPGEAFSQLMAAIRAALNASDGPLYDAGIMLARAAFSLRVLRAVARDVDEWFHQLHQRELVRVAPLLATLVDQVGCDPAIAGALDPRLRQSLADVARAMSLVDADDQHWRAATLRGIDEAFALMGMIVDIYHGPATTGGE